MKRCFLTILIILPVLVFAQQETKKSKRQLKEELKKEQVATISKIIRSKNFIFKAETVNSMNTKTKTLISDFGIEVRNDTVFSYMPYYGDNYSSYNTSHKNSPMGFIQPIDSYSYKKTKKGYLIGISLTNNRDVIDLKFHIKKDGITTVSASSINRASISYLGVIVISPEKMTPEQTEDQKQ